jgi:hypothetical protein
MFADRDVSTTSRGELRCDPPRRPQAQPLRKTERNRAPYGMMVEDNIARPS